MKDFGKEKMDLKGVKSRSSTCDTTSMQKAQKVLSATGSCAGDALKGLASRGFEKERANLEKGVMEKKAGCEGLDGDKLDMALAESDAMLDNKTKGKRSKSSNAGAPTMSAAMMKEKSSKNLTKCLKAVAPERVGSVRCDIAPE